jgi:hypothetical protein
MVSQKTALAKKNLTIHIKAKELLTMNDKKPGQR